MSAIAEGLTKHLRDDSGTGPLLAGHGQVPVRVYPLVIPQKKPGAPSQFPAVVFTLSWPARQKLFCRTDRTVQCRAELDCYATRYDEAHQLADAVRAALLDFRGVLGGIVPVKDVSLEGELDLQDPEPGLYRVNQTWVIWHAE